MGPASVRAIDSLTTVPTARVCLALPFVTDGRILAGQHCQKRWLRSRVDVVAANHGTDKHFAVSTLLKTAGH